MRIISHLETSSEYSTSKKRISVTAGAGKRQFSETMEYPDGSGNDRQQGHFHSRPPEPFMAQHQLQHQLQHQEVRQPQHRDMYSQQQQPPQPASFTQQHTQSAAPSNMYAQRMPYAQHPPVQQDISMGNTQQSLEHEYIRQQQTAQQQYLQQQQYAAPGYPSIVPPAQYAPTQQHLPYQYALQQQHHQQQFPGGARSAYPPMELSQQHAGLSMSHPPPPHVQLQQPFIQPKVGRLPSDRPLIKLSVSLIDTYKHINTIYYEERETRRAARAKEKANKKSSSTAEGSDGGAAGSGTNNNGWDDENYDYIVNPGELFYGRYKMKERIGKGSFGQVVRAEDTQEGRDVAIKIIKSKKPFLMQAKTEIELLTHLKEKDTEDQYNIVRLITHFMHRNHQCLVFEMLSLNLYELLKNTQFGGVSLNLIRKFAKQVLKSLSFLGRKDVDVIHCDLKPENILLRHPKKSGIKVIDFGSSCRSNKRMYSYIQSRFYRSPEVMLGLPYAVSIDMWSLGCILAEMHTGEPLFSGSDQFDQMQKIVKLLGMMPSSMLEQAGDQHRLQFFEKTTSQATGEKVWHIKQQNNKSSSRGGGSTSPKSQEGAAPVVPSSDPIASLNEVIQAETLRKKKHPPTENDNSSRNYQLFVDLIHRMLAYDPLHRIKPEDALNHPFITENSK